ncbi:2-succinyl-5-enolpyruvyl-6-hydroxy-3-cyclohexene- 1-carboxylate synthase [Alicyclobacillus hesperidum subsp. aegles]|nr:2-succinyl-5-enolpyruvyl-6-hydroxy-3-cyclohexene- 1-carboxylate synthase [Alicyclobacillus hesperidum subsp. aegles]
MNMTLWPVHAFVDGLAATGVRQVVASPGSRNTPLLMAFAEHPQIELLSHLDERSAAYFALGLAKGGGRPVAIVCTSGTAAANYYPAIVEAYMSRVPLIAITADRPPQLREVGANQAIRQMGMFADHVKWFYELPIPDGTAQCARHAQAMAVRAATLAASSPAGPVHLNYPFVEPLVPPRRDEVPELVNLTPPAMQMEPSGSFAGSRFKRLREALASAQRPLVVFGPERDANLAKAVVAFAERTGLPILADIISPVAGSSQAVQHYDAILQAAPDVIAPPDLVLRFGAEPTSKALASWLVKSRARVFVCDETPLYRDALGVASDVIAGGVEFGLNHLIATLTTSAQAYTAAWRHADDVARRFIERFCADHWFEGTAVRATVAALHSGERLFIGNSRPIRDADALVRPQSGVIVDGNRGASGIDGLTSTAFGEALASGQSTVLCIGDVSFYHDTNGLLAAKRFGVPLVIVLIHNDGGGIFQHLSQASRPDTLHHFTTPHGLEFQHIIEAFGGRYVEVEGVQALMQAVRKGINDAGLTVVQATFANEASTHVYKRLFAELRHELERGMAR